jgi:carbonic anhydrase
MDMSITIPMKEIGMNISRHFSKIFSLLTAILFILSATSSLADDLKGKTWLYTQTSQSQQSMTADKALQTLKEGNARFVQGHAKSRNLLKQLKLTGGKGQYPFAVILSCMDSRGSPELIFDQGIGDIFSTRLAGNVLDADQLGGIEFATSVVGSRLIVVMGHTHCGAVAGACSGVELGSLTQLLQKIHPAVEDVKKAKNVTKLDCKDTAIVNEIAKQNVRNVVREIKSKSKMTSDLIDSGDVKIVGAIHDLHTGKVTFFE